MHDPIETAVERSLEHLAVGDVALDEIDTRIGVRLEVDDPYGRAGLAKVGDHVAPDEPGPAGDEDSPPGEVSTHDAGASSLAVFGSSFVVSAHLTVGAQGGQIDPIPVAVDDVEQVVDQRGRQQRRLQP